MVTAPQILATQYPNKLEDYYVYWNVTLGFGNTLGPVISAILCIWLSYTEILTLFAILICMVSFSALYLLPKSLDANQIQEENSEMILRIGYFTFFKNVKVVMIILVCVFAQISVFFFDPVLPLRIKSLGGSNSTIALFFALINFSFVLGSMVSGILSARCNKMLLLILLVVVQVVGLFQVGYKLFPGSAWLFQIAVSVSLLGFAAGCVSSPIISLVIETMEK